MMNIVSILILMKILVVLEPMVMFLEIMNMQTIQIVKTNAQNLGQTVQDLDYSLKVIKLDFVTSELVK